MEKVFCYKCGKQMQQCPSCKVYYCPKCKTTIKENMIGKIINKITRR